MKNPHGVEPIRLVKRKVSKCAIKCDPNHGPVFGTNVLFIKNCVKENECFIYNDGMKGYECHSKYKSSLFVNSNKPNEKNYFSVLDYEVYTH